MIIKKLKLESNKQIKIITLILLITDISVFFNIPILRMIIGFFLIAFLPGLLILQILKLDKLYPLEKLVLTCGLSISFFMLFGLLINNLSLFLNYEKPLASIPLLIMLNVVFMLLAFIGHKKDREEDDKPILSKIKRKFVLSPLEKAFLIVPLVFPTLSIFGMQIMNETDNNSILMLLIYLIALYILFVTYFNKSLSKRLYPVIIFLISISLLLLLPLRSNHLIGVDVHTEYYLFRTVLDQLHWRISGNSTLDACISVSLLPAIFQSLLGISPEYLFKFYISLIYSISPLIIYIISKKYIDDKSSFLAACFFMFQPGFLWTEYYSRTNFAVLFFALAMMVLFNNNIDLLRKRILFIIFIISCMLSHYATTYIFFSIILGAVIGMEIIPKKYHSERILSRTMVTLFFVSIFFWYSQVTGTAFDKGLVFIGKTFNKLNEFFIAEMRGAPVQALFGEGFQRGLPYTMQFALTWLTIGFIAIGVTTLIVRYKEMSFPEMKFKKNIFLKEKLEVEYWLFTIVCSGLAFTVIVFPFVSVGYGIERLYSLITVIISIFFVIGGIIISKNIHFKKQVALGWRNKDWHSQQIWTFGVVLLVLLPYFLSVSGAMHQMFGYPYQITLNSEGRQYDNLYIHDQENYCTKWIKQYSDDSKIYTDFYGAYRLISQAGIALESIDRYDLTRIRQSNGYIYLRYYNVVKGKWADYGFESGEQYHNLTAYHDIFVRRNNIYVNGGSKVFK